MINQAHNFIDNKYTKWYFSIIENARSEFRKKDGLKYFESHHIIPKCSPFCGSNKKENIVLLTAKEHFLCHLLLTKMCEGIKKHKMIWALHRMSFSAPSENRILKSYQYETARRIFSIHLSKNHPSKDPKWREKVAIGVTKDWEDNEVRKKQASEIFSSSHNERKLLDSSTYYNMQRRNSEKGAAAIKEKWESDLHWANEQRQKMSNRTKGENNPMYGKELDSKHKEKLSKATSRKRWMHNDFETVYIDKDLVKKYSKNGYKPGRNNYSRKETR
jgi:hypothetical protein